MRLRQRLQQETGRGMTSVFEIPGVPEPSGHHLAGVLLQQPGLEQVWLFGSRAMGSHRPGSDLDLCLVGDAITHQDRLRLMHAIDELLLPWTVDRGPGPVARAVPEDMCGHLQLAGRCLWHQHRSAPA